MLPGLDLGRHVGQLELNSLKARRSARPNCLPSRRVLERLLERAFRNPERQCGNADAAGVERLHEVDEAHPLLAEQVLFGHLDVLEDELAGVRGPPAELVSPSCRLESRPSPATIGSWPMSTSPRCERSASFVRMKD